MIEGPETGGGAPDSATASEMETASIESLPAHFAVTLPLLAFGLQIVLGLVLGFFIAVSGIKTNRESPLLFALLLAISSGAFVYIVGLFLERRKVAWSELRITEGPNMPAIVAVAGGCATAVLATLAQRAIFGWDIHGAEPPSGFTFIVLILAVGVFAPLAEEIMFRGVVFPVLRAKLGDVSGAVAISALIFAAFHLTSISQMMGALFLGVPLALLRHWSGTLVAPIAMHMTHNIGVVVILALGLF